MSEIIININEANKAQKYQDEKELFQIEAFKNVAKILQEHKVGKDTSDITDCRFHDTIFIDGDRGVGKTAFMINIQHYYDVIDCKNNNNCMYSKDDKKRPKYIFLKPVDPTLLEHTEKFLSVVLARIVEYVSKEKVNDEDYYKALENLSKSLEAIKTLDKDVGIEEIASNKSSLKLEQHAHEFFKIVSKMFDVDAIIMLIDDVDMAFDKGFDVLEVVRKYLASPYLIPIVAGDMKLYREIVETKFMDKIDFNKDISAYNQMKSIFEKGCDGDKENIKNWDNSKLGCDHELLIQNREELKEKRNLVDNIVKQYLEKLFPNEYHIKLKDIFSILKENNVQIKFHNDLFVPYTEVKDFEIRHINLGINQVEFTYQIFSNNTRDLMQYLYSKRDIYIYFFTKLGAEYSQNAEHKKYFSQNVIKKYDSHIMDMILNEKELYKKSLEITSKVYEFGDTKQKELSKLTENDVRAYRSGRYHIYNAFLGNVFEKTKLSTEEGKESIAIYYRDFDKVKSFQDKDKYIVDLFVHSNYYSNTNKTKNYIFAGSFIELMFFSFTSNMKLELRKSDNCVNVINFNEELIIDKRLHDKFEEIKKCYNITTIDTLEVPNILDDIAYKIPFNSIFKKNKNFESDTKNSDEEEILTSISHDKILSELSLDILVWRNAFIDDIKINSISMYEIMHKFFNNLNTLKIQIQNQKLVTDTPLTFMQRIVFIFINAVAFFENTERRVAQTNIAMSENFDMQILLKNTNAFNQNIKPLLNQKSLTRALFFHPIISHILFPYDNSKLEFLRFSDINSREKETLDKVFYTYWQKAGFYKRGLPQKMNPLDICKNYLKEIIYGNFEGDYINKLANQHSKYFKTYFFIKDFLSENWDTELDSLMKRYEDLISK